MTHPAIIDRWNSLAPAERDMWVRRVLFPEIRDYPRDHLLKDCCPVCGYDGVWPRVRVDDSQPYTQHPAAAWLVVERMRERKHHLNLTETATGWWAQFWSTSAIEHICQEKAAEAICLAALLALAGERGAPDV